MGARDFSAALSRCDDLGLRLELRDEFERLCEKENGYIGRSYNTRAEQAAFDKMRFKLGSHGLVDLS